MVYNIFNIGWSLEIWLKKRLNKNKNKNKIEKFENRWKNIVEKKKMKKLKINEKMSI